MSSGPLALAQETGGTFFRDSNDLIAGLRLLGSTPEVSYLLGFSPQDVKLDGSYHKLNVTVTNGIVNLWGLVESDQERQAVRIAAEAIAGVVAVNDHLKREPLFLY